MGPPFFFVRKVALGEIAYSAKVHIGTSHEDRAMQRLRRLFSIALLAGWALPAWAIEAPQGRVLLTVAGEIGITNHDGVAEFDRAMLEALDWRNIETFTSFTDGPQQFGGPTLVSLLEVLEVDGTRLRATAINDYAIEIPIAHAAAHDVLLAMDHNGRAMRVRDKGPIWVVYPLSAEQVVSKPFDGEMIWQLVRLEVLP